MSEMKEHVRRSAGFDCYESGHPTEQIGLAIDVLDVLAVLFEGENPPDLNARSGAGVNRIIITAIKTLEAAMETVDVEISNPYGHGYSAGVRIGAQEYRRGFREGQAATIKAMRKQEEGSTGLDAKVATVLAEAVAP